MAFCRGSSPPWPRPPSCWYRDYKSDPRNVKYELLKVFIIKHGNFLIVKE